MSCLESSSAFADAFWVVAEEVFSAFAFTEVVLGAFSVLAALVVLVAFVAAAVVLVAGLDAFTDVLAVDLESFAVLAAVVEALLAVLAVALGAASGVALAAAVLEGVLAGVLADAFVAVLAAALGAVLLVGEDFVTLSLFVEGVSGVVFFVVLIVLIVAEVFVSVIDLPGGVPLREVVFGGLEIFVDAFAGDFAVVLDVFLEIDLLEVDFAAGAVLAFTVDFTGDLAAGFAVALVADFAAILAAGLVPALFALVVFVGEGGFAAVVLDWGLGVLEALGLGALDFAALEEDFGMVGWLVLRMLV